MGDLLTQYRAYVRANATTVKQAEEVARTLALLAPVGGEHKDVVTETTYATLGVLGVLNDALIHGKTKRQGLFQHRGVNDPPHVWALRAMLTVLRHAQVLLELCTKKFLGDELRWRVVRVIEYAKALALAALLCMFPRDVLFAAGVYESHVPDPKSNAQPQQQQRRPQEAAAADAPEEQPEAPAPSGSDGDADADAEAARPPLTPDKSWVGRRSGRSLTVPPALQKYGESGLV